MIFLRRALSSTAKVRLPKLAVFDIDHTLWGFGVDTFCYTPPYHIDKSTGKLIDMSAKTIEAFPYAETVLKYVKSLDMKVAVASRTRYPSGAYTLLEMLNLKQHIDYFEIYPGVKTKHFERIHAESGVPYSDIIFFDDEERNIVDVSKLGVYAVLVDHDKGATEEVVKDSLSKFAQQAGSAKAEST